MVKVIQSKKNLYKLLFLVVLVLPASSAYADGNTTDFSITVNPSLSLSVSSASVNFEITPTQAGAYNSANFTVTSATNNAYGYTLVMGTSNVNLTSNAVNPNTGTNPTVPTLTETQDGITAAQFEASTDSSVLNHYGVAIGANNNFNAMKTTKQVKKTTTNNASGVDTTTIALASKLDLNTVPGTYSTTINFQMTANPLPGGLEEAYQNAGKTKKTIGGKEYYAMQDMNSTICSNTTIQDDQLQVYDNRDNKIYWIAKLRDGHCWMTQNLDLDLEITPNHVAALTHYNTDLGWGSDAATTSWASENATSIVSNGGFTDWVSDASNPYSADPGDWYWSGAYSSSYCTFLTTSCPQVFSTDLFTANGMHGHVGNYYNWTAAIASNDSSNYDDAYGDNGNTYGDITENPQNSICPAGWRLPTISSASDIVGSTNEFKRLITLYGNNVSDDMNLIASPLFFVRGGAINLSTVDDVVVGFLYAGNFGSYWSSTVVDSYSAYYLWLDSNSVEPTGFDIRDYGFPVRCVAR